MFACWQKTGNQRISSMAGIANCCIGSGERSKSNQKKSEKKEAEGMQDAFESFWESDKGVGRGKEQSWRSAGKLRGEGPKRANVSCEKCAWWIAKSRKNENRSLLRRSRPPAATEGRKGHLGMLFRGLGPANQPDKSP